MLVALVALKNSGGEKKCSRLQGGEETVYSGGFRDSFESERHDGLRSRSRVNTLEQFFVVTPGRDELLEACSSSVKNRWRINVENCEFGPGNHEFQDSIVARSLSRVRCVLQYGRITMENMLCSVYRRFV